MMLKHNTHRRLSSLLKARKSSSTSNDASEDSRCGWTLRLSHRQDNDDNSSHTTTSSLSDSFSEDDSSSNISLSDISKPLALPRRSSLKVKTIHESLLHMTTTKDRTTRTKTTTTTTSEKFDQPPRRHGVVFGQVDIRYHERIESIPREMHLQNSRGPSIEFDWECVDSTTFETLDSYEKSTVSASSTKKRNRWNKGKISSRHLWLSKEEREQVVKDRNESERDEDQEEQSNGQFAVDRDSNRKKSYSSPKIATKVTTRFLSWFENMLLRGRNDQPIARKRN